MTGVQVGIFFCLCILTVGKGDVIVETSSGKVAGVEVKSIIKDEKFYAFMGIPYAEPPLGSLRFMPPKPHKGWTNILNAKKEKKPCSQQNFSVRSKSNYGFCGTEDCLHLSIFTPKLPSDEPLILPVLVFLYNEQIKTSHNASKEFGPDFFMNEDVILVHVHHRLSSLGFLSFEDDLLPGNNGLRDIILALQWLKINVENFGGDPNKITLMGSDGGAVLVDILLHSPKAKGLFSAAILQGGTSWSSVYFNGNAQQRAIKFSESLEVPSKTSSSLKKQLAYISDMILTEKETFSVHADEARSFQVGNIPFGPNVEHEHPDAVITKLPEETDIDINIPIMIGRNSREGIEFSNRLLQRPQFLTFADRDFLLIIPIRYNFHFELNTQLYYDVVEEIKSFYFEEGYIKVGGIGEYITYIGDIMSFYPLDYTVRKYANESKAPVYYYTFDYSGEFNLRKQMALQNATTIDGTWGATTADELCYLFVCKSIKKAYNKALQEEESEDMKVLRNMVRMWTNFAKTGNPTPSNDDIKWTPATKEDRDTFVINEEPRMVKRIHEERVIFWDIFLEKYKSLAVDGVVTDNTKDEL